LSGYAVRLDPSRGELVNPGTVRPDLADLVARVQQVSWPLWIEPGARLRREVAELCRLQAARGLTVLSWLAAGGAPPDTGWLLSTQRLAGPRQGLMYGTAEGLPHEVRALVVANWTWVLTTPLGGRVTAPFLASRAYPDDGYAAAHATMALAQLWERHPETRQALAAAWAATRTPDDWCKAAELRAVVFSYPRGPLPARSAVRPWISRLLAC
jgi:hypothetical protein